jgi:hypothetical protein
MCCVILAGDPRDGDAEGVDALGNRGDEVLQQAAPDPHGLMRGRASSLQLHAVCRATVTPRRRSMHLCASYFELGAASLRNYSSSPSSDENETI